LRLTASAGHGRFSASRRPQVCHHFAHDDAVDARHELKAFGGGEEYARREPFPSLGDQPHEDLGVQPAFAHGNDALHPGFERLGADGVEEHRQQLDLTARRSTQGWVGR